MTFVRETSDYRHVSFLWYKSDVYEKFKEFGEWWRTNLDEDCKFFTPITAANIVTKVCIGLKSRGIRMENSAPYTPEENGKAERENCTIMKSARTIMKQKNLPKTLWAEAVNTAVYVLNRTSHSKTPKQTPFEIWYGKKPDLSHVRVFGSVAYMHVPQQMRKKLMQRQNG